ncbi:MAG TPA: carbohydrate porin [Cyanobacteria bacterium UBA8803]|nr:carbohydrate porin [Cyanobacteria bacterium UBA9273]HBL60658.1 carbohydrate porin [Cyanobacteria bacterium UBA8803]
MLKIFWKALGQVPATLGAALIVVNTACPATPSIETEPKPATTAIEQANLIPVVDLMVGDRYQTGEEGSKDDGIDRGVIEPINQYPEPSDPLSEITPVSELSDVQPTDWAFQALQSLNERYDCMVGYPDGTYRGNRFLTRYEFAAGLNACLNQLSNSLIGGDLTIAQRLIEEFSRELEAIKERTDRLDELAIRQFSTTTQLEGEAIVAISAAGGEKPDDSGEKIDRTMSLSNRVRLDLVTSFTGKDRLTTRLQGRNLPDFGEVTGTEMARLAIEGDDENDMELSELEYRFPVGKKVRVYISAVGGSLSSFTDELNAAFEEPISRFGKRNPIYGQGGSTGVGLRYKISDFVSLSLGYLADDANDPETGIAVGAYGAIAQLTFTPSDYVGIGLTYVRSYNSLDTGTGSDRANDPFDGESESIAVNSYGLEVSTRVSSRFTIGGWVGFTEAIAQDLPDEPEAEIFNYALTFALLDFGTEGSVAGIVIGQPPKAIDNNFQVKGREYEDEDTALHLELFYKFRATDNIDITPGLLVIVNPEHDESNDTIYVGTIRTTFRF